MSGVQIERKLSYERVWFIWENMVAKSSVSNAEEVEERS